MRPVSASSRGPAWRFGSAGPWAVLLALLACGGPLRCGPPPNPERGLPGRTLWIFRTGGAPTTPVLLGDGAIVLGTSHGRVLRLSEEGEEMWNVRMPGRVAGVARASDGQAVYVGMGRGGGGAVIALDADTGAKRWMHRTPGRIPLPVVADDGTVVVGGGAWSHPDGPAGTVWTLAPDGKEQWQRAVGKDLATTEPALAPDGSILVATSDGTAVLLASNGEERWRVGDARVAEPISLAATEDGRFAVLAPTGLALLTADGRVSDLLEGAYGGKLGVTPGGVLLVTGLDGTVSAIGPDGRRRWRRNLERRRGSGRRRRIRETPVDVVGTSDEGGLVLLVGEDGERLRALIRLDERGRRVWREKLTGIALSFGHPVSRPNGTILVPAGHWNRQVAKTATGELGHQRLTCIRD